MPGAEPAPAMIILSQARATVRELGFTLRQDVDRAEYRLRPVALRTISLLRQRSG
jgi:hypothetical protein